MKIEKIKLNRNINLETNKISSSYRIYKLMILKDYKKNYTIYFSINKKNPFEDKTEVPIIKDTNFTTKINNINIYPLYIEK